jgi:hypothetical protein
MAPVFELLFQKCRPPGRPRLQGSAFQKCVGPAGRHLLARSATGLATGVQSTQRPYDSVTVRREVVVHRAARARKCAGTRTEISRFLPGTTALCFTVLANIHADTVI